MASWRGGVSRSAASANPPLAIQPPCRLSKHAGCATVCVSRKPASTRLPPIPLPARAPQLLRLCDQLDAADCLALLDAALEEDVKRVPAPGRSDDWREVDWAVEVLLVGAKTPASSACSRWWGWCVCVFVFEGGGGLG